MLNELFALSKALSEMNISTKIWHREYKPLPNATAKAPCFKISVSETGDIESIHEIPHDTVRVLRKFGNNQASFPAFNIRPLYRVINNRHKELLEKMMKDPSCIQIEHIRELIIHDNWHKSLKSIDGAIHVASDRMLKAFGHNNDDDGLVVIRLIQSVCSLNGGFRVALESYILSELKRGEKSPILLHFLLHSGNENKAAVDDMGKNISVMLDLAEWGNYGYPVASEHITHWVNDALIRADKVDVSDTVIEGVDAFGSPRISGWSEPMPSVKLPGFDVTLRAMFQEQRCQQRYGEFNDGSYPISKENRVAAKQAFEWLAEREHEGLTWKRADSDEVVFAYPSKLTPTPVRLTSLFGAPPGKENEKAKARFGKSAEDYIKSFKGIPPKEQPDYIRIFSIRKMDKARSKVVLTRNCSPTWLADAAVHWQQGCSNIPYINFVKALTPFPLDVARVVNTVWKRDGKQITVGRSIVKRMQSYQGVELLLDLPGVCISDNERIACLDKSSQLRYSASDSQTHYFLRILLTNTEGLINHFGNSIHSGTFVTPYYAKIIANITAVLGLLLYKNKYMKEDYMQNTAFLLGQILKSSDELHTFYCKVERNGDIPSQLAGNSMFAFASEAPLRALAQLGLRMQPYISWARRYSAIKVPKSEIANGLVGWNLGIFEDICKKLANILTESTRFNDYDKAQLFLGYLASYSNRDEVGTDQSTDSTNII